MNLISQTFYLIKKDVQIEWRQKYAFGGILVYVAATVFIIYMVLSRQNALDTLKPAIWNILFWMTLLFASVNAIAKSFFQESHERQLYYYLISSPQAIILGKMIYNFFIMLILTTLCLAIFSLMIGAPMQRMFVFAAAALLGGSSFSFLFSTMSAIAAKANNNSTLMAILGFPVILPLLIIIIKLSAQAMSPTPTSDVLIDIGILVALNMILLIMALVLFPYLWRD